MPSSSPVAHDCAICHQHFLLRSLVSQARKTLRYLGRPAAVSAHKTFFPFCTARDTVRPPFIPTPNTTVPSLKSPPNTFRPNLRTKTDRNPPTYLTHCQQPRPRDHHHQRKTTNNNHNNNNRPPSPRTNPNPTKKNAHDPNPPPPAPPPADPPLHHRFHRLRHLHRRHGRQDADGEAHGEETCRHDQGWDAGRGERGREGGVCGSHAEVCCC